MRIILTTFLLFLGVIHASTALAQAKEPDAEGCKDHALVTRMPGFYINWCKSSEFDALTVHEAGREKTAEGKLTIINYWEGQGAQGKSVLQVQRNYENALRQAGFAVTAKEPYLTLRRRAGGSETWVVVQAQQQTHELHILEVQAMQQEVTADASALRAELDKSGRVAVYGIHFDTGKATLRPEAESVLQEVLKLLNQDPKLRLRVEGHTDAVGKPADNLQLSRARAAAVRQWLLGRGVGDARLTSEGHGQTKPIDDNSTDSGRAKNRRVELVKL